MAFDIKSVSATGNGFANRAVSVSYSQGLGSLQSAGGAMSYLYVSYGSSDHHVRTIEGFVTSVTFNVAQNDASGALTAGMDDDSGHKATATFTAAFPAYFS
jgi:hypothetical protein